MFSGKSKVLEDRVNGLETNLQERLAELGSADAALGQRLQLVEAALQSHRQSLEQERQALRNEIAQNSEAASSDLQAHLQALRNEIAQNSEAAARELRDDLQSVRDAVATLAQECSLCASNSRAEDLQQEIDALRRNMSFFCHAVEDQQREAPRQEQVAEMQDRLAEQNLELERLRVAISGDGTKLRAFMDEEAMRQNNLRVEGASAEWLVRDVEAWIDTVPKGKFIESPSFGLDVPGVGRLDEIRLRFFPNGGPNVITNGTCSLYLSHPAAVPWAQYELTVGRSRRGTFDPIYSGGDDFCALAPEVFDLDGSRAVRLSVQFLPLAPKQSPNPAQLTASSWASVTRSGRGSPALSSAASARSKDQAPQVAGLWQSSNRLV